MFRFFIAKQINPLFIIVFKVFFLWTLLFVSPTGTQNTRPNFIILIADDLGFGDVSILGNDTLPTANIDRIGRAGVTLTHHLTAASVCTPSRSAFLTGRYPIRSGMTSPGRNRVFFFVASSGGLPSNETTFVKSLKKANYSTALFGKWHLGKDCQRRDDNCHHPNKHGFDYYFGTIMTNLKDFGNDGASVILSYYPNLYLFLLCTGLLGICIGLALRIKQWNTLSGIVICMFILVPCLALLFQKNIKLLNSVLYRNEQIVEQPVRLEGFTDRLVQECSQFIRHNHDKNKPFLAMVNFLKVHTAHFPSSQFQGKSGYGKYGDSVLELDYAVGQMLDLIEQLEIQNNTFVYFSSDNGGHLEEVSLEGQPEGGSNGIFRGGKGHGAMEGGIRVPTLAMWPGVLPAGRVVSVPTSQMDIFATIHAIVGQELPRNVSIDGQNILPLMQGHSEHSPHQFLFHYCGTYLHGLRWVQDLDHVWKVYFFTPNYKPNEEKCAFVCMCYGASVIQHDPPLVYNIATDPSERNPLNPNSDNYQQVLSTVQVAADAHRQSVSEVTSQFSFANSMWKPWLQPCCSFPFCRC